MIESATSFSRRADTRYRRVGSDGIVVKQTAGEVLVLNDVGARILEVLQSGVDVGGLVRALAGEYDVDPVALAGDVLAYLQELLDAEVIEVVPPRRVAPDER